MRGVRSRRPLAGGIAHAAVVPLAALAVHQVRYWLTYGDAAGAVLTRQGHAYLSSVAPWAAVLAALAVGGFLRALGRSLGGRQSARRHAASFLALWLVTVAALVVLYAAQEGLEGLLATGHPAGLAGIFGHGGVWAVPAAACIGLVLASALYGGRRLVDAVARLHTRSATERRSRVTRHARPGPAPRPRLAPVAAGWSDRGPPAVA
jgi:hypothetical protein